MNTVKSAAAGPDAIPGAGGDDLVMPFEAEGLDARGRIVRLGPVVDDILTRHAYPAPVSRLLGEAIALTALLGASLKFDGRFILQTQSDGPISMMVADFAAPGQMRACASFDAGEVEEAVRKGASLSDLFGTGHLAMTIDPGPEASRYQGVVPLEGQTLAESADLYFRQSEQIPTVVRLAVAESTVRDGAGKAGTNWRAGGILLQHIPKQGGVRRDLPAGDAPHGWEDPDDGAMPDSWVEARMLTETVEDHELTDPMVGPDRLLFRLFHERGVRLFDPQGLEENCHCSRERIMEMLERFTREELDDMTEKSGTIAVTCHFCSARYRFDPSEVTTRSER